MATGLIRLGCTTVQARSVSMMKWLAHRETRRWSYLADNIMRPYSVGWQMLHTMAIDSAQVLRQALYCSLEWIWVPYHSFVL